MINEGDTKDAYDVLLKCISTFSGTMRIKDYDETAAIFEINVRETYHLFFGDQDIMQLEKDVNELFKVLKYIRITDIGLEMRVGNSKLIWQETRRVKPEKSGKLDKLPNQSLKSNLSVPNLQNSMVYTN